MIYLYVDMDGVLTDFELRYRELFGEDPKTTRDKKDGNKGQYSTNWHRFVDGRNFATLDWHKGGLYLVEEIDLLSKSYKMEIKILTSSGGTDRHNEVAQQKLEWVEKQGLSKWPTLVVPGRRYKKLFSNKDSFMIDDTPDVVENFITAGGNGALHVEPDYTVHRLTEYLKERAR